MSSEDREQFVNYVNDVSQVQRNRVASRVERLVGHEKLAWQYFTGCVAFTTGSCLAIFKLWGPRHMFKNSLYYCRPLPPAISMGVALFGLLYTCRGMLIRNRICIMIEDYEYELKRIKAHHCEEGVTQLAWLEFVKENLKQRTENRFDFKKMRESPQDL